jgi:CHASE3 domain sensor protein
MFVLTLYVFIGSFKDPTFKRKSIISKIIIYFFIIVFLICGILTMSGNPNKTTNALRQEIHK